MSTPLPANTDAGRFELHDDLWRCPACGRFQSRFENFVDHSRRGCPEREGDDGIDNCGCEPEAFCTEACADRWHRGAR